MKGLERKTGLCSPLGNVLWNGTDICVPLGYHSSAAFRILAVQLKSWSPGQEVLFSGGHPWTSIAGAFSMSAERCLLLSPGAHGPAPSTDQARRGPGGGLPPRMGPSTKAFSLWRVSGRSETLFQAGCPKKDMLPGPAL